MAELKGSQHKKLTHFTNIDETAHLKSGEQKGPGNWVCSSWIYSNSFMNWQKLSNPLTFLVCLTPDTQWTIMCERWRLHTCTLYLHLPSTCAKLCTWNNFLEEHYRFMFIHTSWPWELLFMPLSVMNKWDYCAKIKDNEIANALPSSTTTTSPLFHLGFKLNWV